MRIEDITRNNKELQQNCPLNTEEGRQKAIISVLTDISETLAIIADLYGIVHGREVNPRQRNGQNVEQ